MRTALALAAVAHFASPAWATSINPSPPGWAKASPNGQFVFVRVTPHGWQRGDHPDMRVIEERCKQSGLYRRGEWDAPVWTFDTFGPWSVYLPSDDGVHLVEYSYVTPWFVFTLTKEDRQYRDSLLDSEAFKFYANGKLVRTALVREVIADLDAVIARLKWLDSAEFRSDGLFHVVAADGNVTAFDPVTGRRVRGKGVPRTFELVGWPALAAVGVAVGGALLVRRVRRTKAVKHAHARLRES